MSKTSFFLVAILVIAAGFYCYIKFTPQKKIVQSLVTHPTAISPVTTSEVSLITSPVRAGQTIRVLAMIYPAESNAGLVQLEIGFDPIALTPFSIMPGTYFKNAKVYLKTVNQHTGRISYAVGCAHSATKSPCVKNSNQPAAIITFTANPYAQMTNTTVKLLPKTLLKSADDHEIPFKTSGASIALHSGITSKASSSALDK